MELWVFASGRKFWSARPIYMDAALNQLRKEGFPVYDEDVIRLSSFRHGHINMLGRYSFAMPDEVKRGELRPLRTSDNP